MATNFRDVLRSLFAGRSDPSRVLNIGGQSVDLNLTPAQRQKSLSSALAAASAALGRNAGPFVGRPGPGASLGEGILAFQNALQQGRNQGLNQNTQNALLGSNLQTADLQRQRLEAQIAGQRTAALRDQQARDVLSGQISPAAVANRNAQSALEGGDAIQPQPSLSRADAGRQALGLISPQAAAGAAIADERAAQARQFTTSEREGSQTFRTGERVGSQGFRADESAKDRSTRLNIAQNQLTSQAVQGALSRAATKDEGEQRRESAATIAGARNRASVVAAGIRAGASGKRIVNSRDKKGNKVTQLVDLNDNGKVIKEIGRGPSVQFQPTTLPTANKRADLTSARDTLKSASDVAASLIAEIDSNPQRFGFVGSVVGTAQTIGAAIAETINAGGFLERVVDDIGLGKTRESVGKLFDPRLPQITVAENALAYALAKKRKPNKVLNRQDVELAKRDVKLRGLTTAADVRAKLNAIKTELDEGVSGLEKTIGPLEKASQKTFRIQDGNLVEVP